MPNRPRRMVDFMKITPRRCVITNYPNSTENGPVLDTGRDIEGYGRVYVTESGARIIAEHFGFAPAAEFAERIQSLTEENERLRAAVNQMPATIERFLDGLQRDTAHLVRDLLGLAPAPAGGDAVVDAAGAEPGEGDAAGDADVVPEGDHDDEAAAAAVA